MRAPVPAEAATSLLRTAPLASEKTTCWNHKGGCWSHGCGGWDEIQPVIASAGASGWGQAELGLNPLWSRAVLNKVRLWEKGCWFGTSGCTYAHSELQAGLAATCLSINPAVTSTNPPGPRSEDSCGEVLLASSQRTEEDTKKEGRAHSSPLPVVILPRSTRDHLRRLHNSPGSSGAALLSLHIYKPL